jgi:HlyD family secretion protein
MNQRIVAIVLVVVIVLGGGYFAYTQLMPSDVEEAQGPLYATQAVVRGDISVGVDVTGQLNPSRSGGIQAPRRSGSGGSQTTYIIEELLKKEGDDVKKGEVIVRLEAINLDTEVENKRKKLENDKEFLSELTGVHVNQIGNINPSMGVTLRAPIDGRVTGFEAEEGTELKQGQIVARIVDDSHIKVTVKLTPGEFKLVEVGQKLMMNFPTFDGFYEAVVTDLNPNPIPMENGKGFVYWATIEGKNPGLVQPGMDVNVGLPTDTPEKMVYFVNSSEVDGFVKEERVLSSVEAIVTESHVKEMSMVKAGDPLISLAGSDVQQMIEEKLDQISTQEMELHNLLSQYEQLEITSPMDGVIAYIEKQEGDTMMPGEWLGHVYTTSDMRMWTEVDDIDVLLVKQGAMVDVTVDALPGEIYKGEVTNVGTMGRDVNGIPRFSVEIKIEGGPQLRPGMQAKCYIDAGSAEDVLLIPLEAIFEEDSKSKVEVLNPDNTTKVVTVELGLMNDRFAEVKSGLEEGELVITGSSADILPSQHIGSKDTLLPGQGDDSDDGNGEDESGSK